MKASTLLLYDSVSYFTPFMEKEDVEVSTTFRSLDDHSFLIRTLFKGIRKLSLRTGLCTTIWYEKWRKGAYSKIIVFAIPAYEHLTFLEKQFPDSRIILWYWDPLIRFSAPFLRRANIEVWSFDPVDCEKYGYKFNTTFYFDQIKVSDSHVRNFDFLFVGKDKGRKVELEELNQQLTKVKFQTKFHVVSSTETAVLSYEDYLKLIAQSKVLVDIIQNGQSGYSLRVMESIFLGKKLLSNDVRLKSERFYRPENIFIWGVDSVSELRKFVNSTYVPLDPDVVSDYTFENWLQRFEN